MKTKNAIIFLLVLAMVGLAAYTAVSGLQIGSVAINPIKDSIKQGLDLKGGVYVVYEAKTDAEGEELQRIMYQTIEVFRNRVDAFGLTEPLIVPEGDKRIRVELPGVKDAQEAIDMIGRTAQLKFVAGDNEEIVLTGANVNKAEAANEGGQYVVNLELDTEGAEAFSDATARVAQNQYGTKENKIYIILDDEVISDPNVRERISGGRSQISGGFDREGAIR